MLRDALDDDGNPAEGQLIGHVVSGGDGEALGALALGAESLVRVGAVGAAVRLVDVQFAPRARASEFGEEVAVAAVAEEEATYSALGVEITRSAITAALSSIGEVLGGPTAAPSTEARVKVQ